MGWTSANQPSTEELSTTNQRQGINDEEDQPSKEAIVARLTSTYNAAMQCVHALHRAYIHMNQQSSLHHMQLEENIKTLRDTAYAARHGFESVLKDPVSASFAPGLFGLLRILSDIELNHSDISENDRNEFHQWFLFSSVTTFHEECTSSNMKNSGVSRNTTKNSIRDLCYLSLVNYADLLTCCSPCRNDDILPYKVSVKGIPQFQDVTCWDDLACRDRYIQEATTNKLALIAYLDATILDNSDPTLWLRAAATARSLSRTLKTFSKGLDCDYDFLDMVKKRISLFQRLEKYSLQCGHFCLPIGTPVNRSIRIALSMYVSGEPSGGCLHDIFNGCYEKKKKLLNMKRYSFVKLACSIISSCQEGLLMECLPQKPKIVANNVQHSYTKLISPIVEVTIPPLLRMPETIIGKIVTEFLQPDGLSADIKNLESTCKSLSTAIIVARSRLDAPMNTAEKQKATDFCAKSVASSTSSRENPQCKVDKEDQNIMAQPSKSHRSSKRVSSRNQSSEKQGERISKRKSIRLLLSALTQYAIEMNSSAMDESRSWHCCYPSNNSDFMDDESINDKITQGINSTQRYYYLLSEIISNINESQCNPIDTMFLFMNYVASNVNDVFSSEHEGLLSLSSCLLDGFDVLRRSLDLTSSFIPLWISKSKSHLSNINEEHLFSLNLLQAELLMKRYERLEVPSTDQIAYDLGLLVSELNSCVIYVKSTELQCRCLWLVVTYYRWICMDSNIEPQTCFEANKLILSKLEEAIACIGSTSIVTRHLCSPGRHGLHWETLSQVTLKAFRDKLKIITYVSQARIEYGKFMHPFNSTTLGSHEVLIPMNKAENENVKKAGEMLFHHFMNHRPLNSKKMCHLVKDFIDCNQSFVQEHNNNDKMKSLSFEMVNASRTCENYQNQWGILWSSILTDGDETCVIPSEKISILSMLSIYIVKYESSSLRSLMLLLKHLLNASKELLVVCSKKEISESGEFNREYDTDDESDSESNDEEMKKDDLYSVVALFFMDKLSFVISQILLDECNSQVAQLDFDLIHIARSILTSLGNNSLSTTYEFMMFCCFDNLLRSMMGLAKDDEIVPIYFVLLAEVLVSSRGHFIVLLRSKSHSCRKHHLKLCERRAHFLAAVCARMADYLSCNVARVNKNKIEASSLLVRLMKCPNLSCPFGHLLATLNWFWEYISSQKSTSSLAGGSISRQLHLSMTDILHVPIAALLIAICGSIGQHKDQSSTLDIFDFYDTDCSIHPDSDDDSSKDQATRSLREHLRLSTQCISVIFQALSEKRIMSMYIIKNGPLLPLVTTRVLSHLADITLSLSKGCLTNNIQEQYDRKEGIWAINYPDHCESIGHDIDDMLCKSYWFLHGIALESTPSGLSHMNDAKFVPESTKGACRLYRCILRISSKYSRKSLPLNALEFVLNSLPSMHKTKIKVSLHRFLFGTLDKSRYPFKPFELPVNFPIWIFNDAEEESGFLEDDDHRELYLVHRGLSHHLTSGPIPVMPCERSGESVDERDRLHRHEEALYKKFSAVFDDLCFSPSSHESWFRAGQCVMEKIDAISDRIRFGTNMCSDSNLLFPPFNCKQRTLSNEQHNTIQLNTKDRSDLSSVDSIELFHDLESFLEQPWSKFSSIKYVATNLQESNPSNPLKEKLEYLQQLYSNRDFAVWQNIWGSLFIVSLRLICYRCFFTSLYLAKSAIAKRQSNDSILNALVSEMCEIVGSTLYTEMHLSVQHGFSISPMLRKAKYAIAESAQACFQFSIELSESIPDTPLWELRFMIGKCEEKKAKGFIFDEFLDGNQSIRLYESYMIKSLHNYATSWQEAMAFDETVGINDTDEGGSSHGKLEAFYRLHATRLKILINAIKYSSKYRQRAQEEGLRLTKEHWYGDKPEGFDEGNIPLREKIWQVLENIVAAMAQCRIDSPYFHRSVYRHAQAICLAPMVLDLSDFSDKRSLETLPSHKSCGLRGCNSNMPCVESAAGIMSVLFDKKRTHICNVWITTTSNSPFEVINSSIRKFNALQTKYLRAYVDCLRLCKKRSILETLSSWTRNLKRDFTGYYYVSACSDGKQPTIPSFKDSLLDGVGPTWFAKSYINEALASCLKEDLIATYSSDTSADVRQYTEGIYECFTRMNVTAEKMIEIISDISLTKFPEEVNALIVAYQVTENNQQAKDLDQLSLFTEAVAKFRCIYSKQSNLKLQKPSKRKGRQLTHNGLTQTSNPKKSKPDGTEEVRSQIETIKKYFTVNVPDGLIAGSTFAATIRYGETTKKVKLKVPSNNSKRLRFQLDVPKDSCNSSQPDLLIK